MNEPDGSKRRIRRPLASALVLVAAATLLVLSIAGPAAATHPTGPKVKARPFTCFAVVTAVNAQGSTITATVKKGNRALKDFRGKTVAFTVHTEAIILKVGGGDPAQIALSAIAPGDRVHLIGRADLTNASAPVFTARLVIDRGPQPLKT
jgi:hypothetical protein